MLWYNAGMKANALFCSAVCCCAALSMPCEAADVAVVPGFDFTNVVVRVSGAPGAQFSLVDSANSTVASGAVPASAHTCDVQLDVASGASLVPASAYAYDVRLGGASIASGAFATGSEDTPAAGEWTKSPMAVGGDSYLFDDVSFAASPSNRVTRTDVDILVENLFEAESLSSPADGIASAAIAAVRSAAGQPEWRAWNGGWVRLDGPAPKIGSQYAVRVVIDFRHAAPRTCYLLSEDGGDTYVVLKHDGNAWIESSSSSADRVSSVKVVGMSSDVTHRAIDGTATVRYIGEGGAETSGSLAEALAYVPSDGTGAAITLLTNVTWPEDGPQSGEYMFDKGGYSLAGVPDGVNVVVDASYSLEFLCNPNLVRWQNTTYYYYRLGPLHFFNGLIYTSGGDVNGNVGPCPIWAVDPVSGAFVDEYDAASEELRMFVEDSAGRLYAPYADIREDYPEQAIFARRGLDGKWEPMQIWPDIRGQYDNEVTNDRIEGYAVHTWDLVAWKGRIFTGGVGLAWGWEGSDSVMSNSSPFLVHVDSMLFNGFLPFDDDLFCSRYGSSDSRNLVRFDETTGLGVPLDTSIPLPTKPPVRLGDRQIYMHLRRLYSAFVENHNPIYERIDSVGNYCFGVARRGDGVVVVTGDDGGNIIYLGEGCHTNTVWESLDGIRFRRRFTFTSRCAIEGFAYHDGYYYFGMGTPYNESRKGEVGDIYRMRDPALDDMPAVEAERGTVVVPEGGRGVVRFRLNKRPSATVTAPVRAAMCVPALRPDVSEVVFTPEDWNEWHEVSFSADDDRIDIVKPGAIVCGGSGSGCVWGAARVEVENNDFRVAETPPNGLVDLTRPDGNFTVTTHLRTERDWPNRVYMWKKPFNDDTTLTNTQQRLCVKSRPAFEVDYDFGEPTVVNAYGIYLTSSAYANSGDSSYAPPRMWTFSGSNDGVHWRVLDRRSCETGWKNKEYRYYSFRNRRAYRKYRITFDHDGYTCAAYTQLSHLEYYNVPQPDDAPGLIIRID